MSVRLFSVTERLFRIPPTFPLGLVLAGVMGLTGCDGRGGHGPRSRNEVGDRNGHRDHSQHHSDARNDSPGNPDGMESPPYRPDGQRTPNRSKYREDERHFAPGEPAPGGDFPPFPEDGLRSVKERNDQHKDDPFIPGRPRQTRETQEEIPRRDSHPTNLPKSDPFSRPETAPEYRPPSRTSNKPPMGPEAQAPVIPAPQGGPEQNRIASRSTSPTASPITPQPSELDKIPPAVREELDLFAQATLQVQRVKLLQERGVQKSLGLTSKQISAFAAVQQEVDAMGKSLQSLAPQERDQRLKGEYRESAQKFANLVDAQLNESQQRLLFREVVRRQQGAIVFLLPGVSQELQLSDPQLAFLYRRIDETRRNVDLNNLYNPLELAKLFRLAREGRQMAENQLTDSQKARFQSLLARN